MNTRKGARPALAVSLDNLLIQLRLRDVPGEHIGQILAEVETHVADTGLDPVKAFGEPGEYAARDTAGSAKPATLTSRYMVLGSLTLMAGFAVLVLIPVLVPTGPTMVSVPGWVLVVAGLLVSFAWLRRVTLDRVVDPRG